MSFPVTVTEIASIAMKEGVDIFDKSSNAYQVWQDTITTLSECEGYKGLRYGCTFEKSSVVDLVVDWESIELHRKFINSVAYGPFSKLLGQIRLTVKTHNFIPTPSSRSVFDSAPVVEMATFFNTDDSFNDNVGKFVTVLNGAEGCLSASHGPIVEKVAKDGAGKPGPAVALCIGWESKDSHEQFRETDTFKKNIYLLRKGLSGAEMHHTSFTVI